MKRSKKIFLWFILIFLAVLCFIAYDFSRRTTFPGSETNDADSVQADTLLLRK